MKRIFDLVFVAVFSPLLVMLSLVTAFVVFLFMGRPILFKHDRPGLNGKVFKMYKFRTMTNETDRVGNLLPDGDRLTKVGRILRKLSLDELPELYNILKGEMSLVGPRPLHVRYLDLYSDYHKVRHDVLPGLTGLAQVSGRNNLKWDERLDLDVEYVKKRSILLDLKILLRTVLVVIGGTGVSSSTHATMEEFKGSRENKSESEVKK